MQTIFTFEKLYQAYLDCRKLKRKTINALKFEWNLEQNLFQLEKELKEKTYKPGRSICFVVKDPSPREIFAASFKDRVVHHLLVREVIEAGEKRFIFDSFACRKGKGVHLAIKRLKKFKGKITKNLSGHAFYCQLDISGFFMSIDQNILYSLFRKLVLKEKKQPKWTKDILWLAKTIIFSKPTKNYIIKGNYSLFNLIPKRKSLFFSGKEKGLPIGNYSSQFFANLYLNQLDQFIKRKLSCKYYLRYVDDFVLLSKNRKDLKLWRNEISAFLNNHLKLKLNPKKQKIQSLSRGIDFLGYFIKFDYVLVRQKVVKRLKSKIVECINNLNFDKQYFLNKSLSMINSYFGYFKHAHSFNLRKDIYNLFNFKKWFVPELNYSYLKIR